jgi:anti-sigma B factor antagonist
VLAWIPSGPPGQDARPRYRSVSPKVPKEPSIRPLFDLAERSLDSHTKLVAPIGDLDAATNPAFRAAVQAATDGERLVLDLSKVSFMSAGAMGVIARARTRMERGHGQLFVICPNPRLRRLFEIAGMADTLDILASTDALPA